MAIEANATESNSRTLSFTVDVELTNRCNTVCDFCPRDRTPHQGVMTDEVFDLVVDRLVEFRSHTRELFGVDVRMSFCGLGEQLLNVRAPEFVRRVVEHGFAPSMCSNGALLDERRSRELIDAGLGAMYVNCGEIGADYDAVYQLPFETLEANLVRFLELAGDRCALHIVLVDHLSDDARMRRVRRFWEARGVTCFFRSPMLNRAGSLDVEGMHFVDMPEVHRAEQLFEQLGTRPRCAAATAYPFIGYDGTYYLCSSDWEKRVASGSVHDDTIISSFGARWQTVGERTPICKDCNHDPFNRVAVLLARFDRGEIGWDRVLEECQEAIEVTETTVEMLHSMEQSGLLRDRPAVARRTIPVRAL